MSTQPPHPIPSRAPRLHPKNKSGLRQIAAHRLRALHCCWIIQELAERKRQAEWGVCTLSPGETGAKRRSFFRGVSYCSGKKSPKTPARRQDQGEETLLYCLSLLFSRPLRGKPNVGGGGGVCHNIITSLGLHEPAPH